MHSVTVIEIMPSLLLRHLRQAFEITMMFVPSSDCTLASRRAGAGQGEEAGGRRGRRGLRQEQLIMATEY